MFEDFASALWSQKEWLFSGIGASIVGALGSWLYHAWSDRRARGRAKAAPTGPDLSAHNRLKPHTETAAVSSIPFGPERRRRGELLVGGVSDVVEWGWDGRRLLRELIALDFSTLDGLVDEHEGSPEQWAPVFMDHPDTWRLLFSEPREVVGYWHFAPLFDHEFKLAMEGQLLDSQITSDKVQFLELPNTYNLYFVQLCMLPTWRSTHNLQLLFGTIFDVVEQLARQGILFDSVCTNAYTETGRSLCKTLRLHRGCDHAERGTIYSGKMRRILANRIASHRPALRAAYGLSPGPS